MKSLVTLALVLLLLFALSVSSFAGEGSQTIDDVVWTLKQGIPNGNLFFPGDCEIKDVSLDSINEPNGVSYKKMKLRVGKKLLFLKDEVVTTVFETETAQPRTKLTIRPYKHWFKDVTEFKYTWSNSGWGTQAFIDKLMGGFYTEESIRILFDKNQVYFLEAKQIHTDIFKSHHIICGNF